MATFSPTSHPSTDIAEQPHHHNPPPQHLATGPFSHQLNPPASTFASTTPHVSRRASRDLRHHASNGAMAGANGNGPMAVPSGRMGNGHGHEANMRNMGFSSARSPPNNKSRWEEAVWTRAGADRHRHFTRALQILPARRVPGWKGLPVPALGRAHHRACALQVLHKGGILRRDTSTMTNKHRATASLARNARSPTSSPTAMSSTATMLAAEVTSVA